MQGVVGGGVGRVIGSGSSSTSDRGHHQQQQHHHSNNVVVNRDGVVMRKGPWMAEEDEILLDYVKKHGPRDWSSIRTKGLLPRTGKSCRLRWVNKLKPDLKTGCKFSPEEERIVIELQARFGNKWARIATYLPGRTDNDVKNFWSTRQKRLARILQTPLPSKSNRNKGRVPVTNEPPTFEVASYDLIPFEEESRIGQSVQTSYLNGHDAGNMIQMPDLQDLGPLFEPPLAWEPLQMEHLSSPALDFPHMFESPELIPGLGNTSLEDKFAWQENSGLVHIPESLPFFDVEVDKNVVKTEAHTRTPDSFFDDFPSDMFDYIENPHPPTSSAASFC